MMPAVRQSAVRPRATASRASSGRGPAAAVLSVRGLRPGGRAEPLDAIRVLSRAAGELWLLDGRLRAYARRKAVAGRSVPFTVGGALGRQSVRLVRAGRLLAEESFAVSAATRVADGSGRMGRLLDLLRDTMYDAEGGSGEILRVEGKLYRFYICWLRDHVHSLKGMRYFDPDELRSAIDLYADWQRGDGMIWDRVGRDMPLGSRARQTWRDDEFAAGGFTREMPGHPDRRFERIPVENDVEYLFIEGLYLTWKATGDTAWMKTRLGHALRAVGYATRDPLRWSEKYQLLKRGYTLDTWDFQHEEDAARSGSAMRILPDRTRFGVFYGDNVGMASALDNLAEMLEAAGRRREAARCASLGRGMRARVDALSWNGRFYTMHVPENPEDRRDLGGTDDRELVTQSNAYSLGRGVDPGQGRAIVETYRRIRREMPATSAGEFYNCYPPVNRGFGGHQGRWEYMNGGVSSITAGELAAGAFRFGHEAYGADILSRVLGWADAHNGRVDCCLRGQMPDPPPPSRCQPLDLAPVANASLRGDAAGGTIPWLDEGTPDNDLRGLPAGRNRWLDTEFEILDPETRPGGSCLILSLGGRFARRATLSAGGQTAASVRLLHACSSVDGDCAPLVGTLEIRYADGRTERRHVRAEREIGHWFCPQDPDPAELATARPPAGAHRLAWRGENPRWKNVGLFAWGADLAFPGDALAEIELVPAVTRGRWMVAAVSLSDRPWSPRCPTSVSASPTSGARGRWSRPCWRGWRASATAPPGRRASKRPKSPPAGRPPERSGPRSRPITPPAAVTSATGTGTIRPAGASRSPSPEAAGGARCACCCPRGPAGWLRRAGTARPSGTRGRRMFSAPGTPSFRWRIWRRPKSRSGTGGSVDRGGRPAPGRLGRRVQAGGRFFRRNSMFKIGAMTDSFRLPIREALAAAKAAGAGGVQAYAVSGEMAPENLPPAGRTELKKFVAGLGLEFAALCGDLGGHGFERAAENPAKIGRSKAIVLLARDLGAPAVTTHIGVVPESPSDPVYRAMRAALAELAAFARGEGVSFAVETGPEPAAVLARLLDDIDDPGLGVNFDPANLAMVQNEDIPAAVAVLGRRIVHTHAKDGRNLRPCDGAGVYGAFADGAWGQYVAKLGGAPFEETPLGEGQVPWPAYLAALRRAGFGGYLTLEREAGDDPGGDIRRAAAFLRPLLERAGA